MIFPPASWRRLCQLPMSRRHIKSARPLDIERRTPAQHSRKNAYFDRLQNQLHRILTPTSSRPAKVRVRVPRLPVTVAKLRPVPLGQNTVPAAQSWSRYPLQDQSSNTMSSLNMPQSEHHESVSLAEGIDKCRDTVAVEMQTPSSPYHFQASSFSSSPNFNQHSPCPNPHRTLRSFKSSHAKKHGDVAEEDVFDCMEELEGKGVGVMLAENSAGVADPFDSTVPTNRTSFYNRLILNLDDTDDQRSVWSA